MGYAVELFFDNESTLFVTRFCNVLAKRLEKPSLSDRDIRPHVSLAVYDDGLNVEEFEEKLHKFAKSVEPFEFCLNSVGTFPGNQGVVYLAPIVSQKLLTVHKEFHQHLKIFETFAMTHYYPNFWVPHCTVTININPAEIAQAITLSRAKLEPIPGSFQEIAVVEFPPVKELLVFKLGSNL